MRAFDYNNITLLPSMAKSAIDETIAFYLNIPNDNIFKYLREDAGLPAPGIYYQGWYTGSRGAALMGQWISALARMYAMTGREELRQKAVFVYEEFRTCCELLQDTDKPVFDKSSHYTYEKLLRAICDLKTYCAYEGGADWLPWLLSFAETTLSRDNLFGDNGNEWYTTSEALYFVYEIFGDEKALSLAKIWEYREFWDLFYKDADPFSKKPAAGLYSEFCHAYSHTNSMNSCAKAYEITGDPYYLKALISFYDFMQQEEVMATGGYGANFEHIMPKYRIIDALRTGHDSFETQCDTYAAFRVCNYLTSFTGQARFGNWVESLIFNASLATIPMTEDGKVIYYSDYNMYGAAKINRQDSWTCCTGTRPLVMMEIPKLIYYTDESGIYVSQFIPSQLSCTLQDTELTLTQETGFPVKDTISCTVNVSAPLSFPLQFRLPAWLDQPVSLSVNGKPVNTSVTSGGWLCIERLWQDGDQVALTLPQSLWMHSLDVIKGGPNAFLHGPVVLAATYTGIQTPNDHMNIQTLVPKMEEIDGQPLHYKVEGNDTITFKPFYEYEEYERYFLYHDTTAHATKRFE